MGKSRRVIKAAAGLAVAAVVLSTLTSNGKGPQGPFLREGTFADGTKYHLIECPADLAAGMIRPAVCDSGTATTSSQARKNNAWAAVNGGYFNLKGGGMSTSYVTVDGVMVADPTKNKLLCENPKLIPFLPQIFNRTELRFFTDSKNKMRIGIARHDQPLAKGATLIHALQAGPRLLPTIDAEPEAFVRQNDDGTSSDSIGTRRPAARTAFGITADGRAVLLCVSGRGQDPESSGVSLVQVAQRLKDLGCVEAINFDGGSSSTMFVDGKVVCGKTPETTVKSVLLVGATAK